MSFTQELSLVPRFGLEVSPALVSFAEMLMLPYAAMQSLIDEELCTNPALERVDAGECPICRGEWQAHCAVCAGARRRPLVGVDGHAGGTADPAAAESDTEVLVRAVRMEADGADGDVIEYLVGCLDAHGLLDRSCAELAADLGVEEAAVARVLEVVRRVGPPGVGATSVAECLLFQLDALELDEEAASLARAVIATHLPALAKGRFSSIAAALGVTSDEIKQVLAVVRCRLRPYPAFDGNVAPAVRYVVPDLVVREHDEIPGEFVVDLVEPALTKLIVRGPRRGADATEASVSQARSFVAQLADRWATLRRVAECAIDRQREFLIAGPAALRPLTRAEIAAELGLHESTVSRTVADKYVLLPDRSIVPLARFFGASGGVDAELQKLLEAADGRVSDQLLAERLCAAGFPIARRTVAKHRARLGYTAAAPCAEAVDVGPGGGCRREAADRGMARFLQRLVHL